MSEQVVNQLSVNDIDFRYVPKEDKIQCRIIKDFITKHEWLGKMPNRPTHRFTASYGNEIMGVIVMATPNAFSNLMGRDRRDQEKLISRGASMSLAPKNMGSSLIMYAINWMVQNTNYRFFTCYSDPTARELGTIYQACNFIYLGQNFGAREMFHDPTLPTKPLFSDREFRKVSYYKIYAREIGLTWQLDWSNNGKMLWENIGPSNELLLRDKSRQRKHQCESINLPPKHKYVYIKGRNKRETKNLYRVFKENNPQLIYSIGNKEKLGLPYPSPDQRGLVIKN